jgi:hypothetical protein
LADSRGAKARLWLLGSNSADLLIGLNHMATAEVRSRRRRKLRPDARPTSGGPGTGRKLRWLSLLGVALLVLLWALPIIVAKSPLRHTAVAYLADVNGRVRVERASLGWFSPLNFQGIEIQDPHGQRFLHVQQMTGETSLWRLACFPDHLGTLHLQQPTIDVVMHDRGSNAEEVLAPWLTSDESDSPLPSIAVEITDGNVSLRGAENRDHLNTADTGKSADVLPPAIPVKRPWYVAGLSIVMKLSSDSEQSIQAKIKGNVRPEPAGTTRPEPGTGASGATNATGQFELDATLRLASNTADADNEAGPSTAGLAGNVTGRTSGFPLESLTALLHRLAPGVVMAGQLDSELQGTLGRDPRGDLKGQLTVQVTTTGLELDAPALGDDHLRIARLELPAQAVWQGGQLTVENAQLNCDLGQLAFVGTVDPSADLLAGVTQHDSQIRGRVDLARLAAALPNTIHLRDQTTVTSGEASFDLATAHGENGLTWQGNVETSDLVATREGRTLRWEKPLQVTLAAYQRDGTPVIEQLQCVSSFLEVEATGTLQAMQATARYDLEQLATELRQFVDLGDLEMSGTGQTTAQWTQDPGGAFTTKADVLVENLVFQPGVGEPWIEPHLVMRLNAQGRREQDHPLRIQTAMAELSAGQDRATANLVEAVSLTTDATWPIDVTARGQIDKWRARLEPWLGSRQQWDASGQVELSSRVVYTPEAIEIDQTQLRLAGFRARGPGIWIDQASGNSSISARWDTKQQRLAVSALQANLGPMALQGNDFAWQSTEAGLPRVEGTLQFTGDVATLRKWLQDPAQPATDSWNGQMRGTVQVSHREGNTKARVQTELANVEARFSDGSTFRDPRLNLEIDATHATERDLLELHRIELSAQGANGTAVGQIAQLSKACRMKLEGQINYDLAQWEPLLRNYLGPRDSIRGKDVCRFRMEGPLSAGPEGVTVDTSMPASAAETASPPTATASGILHALEGEVSLGWQQASIQGFPVGPGKLQLALHDGLLQAAPFELIVSEGRLTAAPVARLDPLPQMAWLSQGPLLSKIRITPEMCNNALMYIVPVMSGVTEAQGRFSVDMTGCQIPLDDPAQGDLSGTFTVHDVEVGPGPLTRELAMLLERPAAARLQRESKVTFRMVQGRVYHRDLELVFPDMTIRTYGSVGLDRTLAIMAEMPVPPKWIGNNPLGDALRERIIRLPIGGTLDAPRIDRNVLQQVSAEFVRGAATDAIQGQLNRQLDKLFRADK